MTDGSVAVIDEAAPAATDGGGDSPSAEDEFDAGMKDHFAASKAAAGAGPASSAADTDEDAPPAKPVVAAAPAEGAEPDEAAKAVLATAVTDAETTLATAQEAATATPDDEAATEALAQATTAREAAGVPSDELVAAEAAVAAMAKEKEAAEKAAAGGGEAAAAETAKLAELQKAHDDALATANAEIAALKAAASPKLTIAGLMDEAITDEDEKANLTETLANEPMLGKMFQLLLDKIGAPAELDTTGLAKQADVDSINASRDLEQATTDYWQLTKDGYQDKATGKQVAGHADAFDIIKGHGEANKLYTEWKTKQPQGIQDLSETWDVTHLNAQLTLYKSHVAQTAKAGADDTAREKKKVTDEVHKTTARTTGAPVAKETDNADDEFDAGFNEQIEKQKARTEEERIRLAS